VSGTRLRWRRPAPAPASRRWARPAASRPSGRQPGPTSVPAAGTLWFGSPPS